MGVYIKGMKMPKDCESCFMVNSCENNYYMLVEDSGNYIPRFVKENCPLVEVPEPHGRLIDAGSLNKFMQEEIMRMTDIERISSSIDSCPTRSEKIKEFRVNYALIYGLAEASKIANKNAPTIIEAEDKNESNNSARDI